MTWGIFSDAPDDIFLDRFIYFIPFSPHWFSICAKLNSNGKKRGFREVERMSLVLPSAPLGTNEIILLIFIGSINDSEGFSVKCNDKWPLQSFWKKLDLYNGVI